jgi:RNA polymerase sigma-70 factor (sigma-E family)
VRVYIGNPDDGGSMTFEEFAVARLPAVLRFAGVLTGDRALAEDVVQEVLIRAYLRWEHIAGMSLPEQYVRKMVVNEFLSWRRRSWRTVPAGPGADFCTMEAPDHAAEHANRDALLAVLTKLPRRQRAVVVLRYYEGFSETEIADMLGCRPATVRGYSARALATLRAALAHHAPMAFQEGLK